MRKEWDMARIPVALQMYTVRDEAAKDFTGTLRQAAEMGYAGVELAGTGGLSAPDLKKVLGDLGLGVAGSHVALPQLEGDIAPALDYYSELGAKYIACPWVPAERRSETGYRQLADTLNTAGARARDRGIQLCYHNHDFEFAEYDGKTGFDLLFGATDPDLVKIELDVYWAAFAGHNPAELIRRYGGRVPLVHLKDMTGDAEPTFAEVGEGRMDFQSIFHACEESGGAAWYIVEQDQCRRPTLESARISLDHLREWGKA
jgi:sugar phosphate isomerase/epimerase